MGGNGPDNPIYTAAITNNRLATLHAIRDKLAFAVDNCSEDRDIAALTLRLTDVLSQIDAMPTSEQVSPADEIAKRRAARRRARAPRKARAKGAG